MKKLIIAIVFAQTALLASCVDVATAAMTKAQAKAQGFTCRSVAVKKQFDALKGYPKGRPSLPGEEKWIVDHWCALECGGIDAPINMEYQQYTDSLLKNRWERTKDGCSQTCSSINSTPTRKVFNCI